MIQKKYVGLLIIVLIGVACIYGFYILKNSNTVEKIPVPDNNSINDTQLIENSNNSIKSAMSSFKDAVNDRNSKNITGLFCTGGFINPTEDGVAQIASAIIQNRIVNNETFEYAHSQDEAGITCLGSANQWVLFSALNVDSTDTSSKYWCVDSSGNEGNFVFDDKTNQCKI